LLGNLPGGKTGATRSTGTWLLRLNRTRILDTLAKLHDTPVPTPPCLPPREETMATEIRAELPTRHPVQNEGVRSAMEAVYNWNYDSEIDQLRTLYANALERQWVAMRDLDWECEIDKEAFSRTFSMGGIPVSETEFWQALPLETRWQISRRTAAFLLSNFLHGEQGALMVAAQLVSAVPHMDGKFYASTQTLDEARHVEAFAAYVRKLDETSSRSRRP
jgi:hypothetical protein